MSNPHYSLPSPATPAVLLAVRDLREEIRAGLGNTALIVRTLDGVSLVVHAGELVVLQGGVASGAVSLLSAMAGTRRRLSGTRVAARGVQVRRGSISDEAFRAVAAAWSQAGVAGVSNGVPDAAPVVYVFRVRRRAPAAVHHRREPRSSRSAKAVWRAWAESLRARGGSVIAHVIDSRDAPGASVQRLAVPSSDEHAAAVHEAMGAAKGYHAESGVVRVFTLAAGRIVGADRSGRGLRGQATPVPPRDRPTPYIEGSSIAMDSDCGS